MVNFISYLSLFEIYDYQDHPFLMWNWIELNWIFIRFLVQEVLLFILFVIG